MWVLSVLIGVAFYYLDQTPILDRSRFTGICICVCILGLCYTKIFFALRRSQIHVQGQVKRAIPLYLARYRKAVHSALWVQLTLVVCYLPFGIVTTFLPKAGEIFFLVYLIALTLIQLNSSLNPFIYCWKISEVRKAVKDTIRELFCSLSQLISISICLISICFSNSSFGQRSLDIAWIPELKIVSLNKYS